MGTLNNDYISTCPKTENQKGRNDENVTKFRYNRYNNCAQKGLSVENYEKRFICLHN